MNLTIRYKLSYEYEEYTRARLLSLSELKSFYIVEPTSKQNLVYKISPKDIDESNYLDRLKPFYIGDSIVKYLGKDCIVSRYLYSDVVRIYVDNIILTVNSLLLGPR
jgi:hypothetical protein